MHTLTVVGSISDNTQTFSTHSMSHFIDLAFFEEHGQALHFFSIVRLSIPPPKLGWSVVTYRGYLYWLLSTILDLIVIFIIIKKIWIYLLIFS